MPSYGAFPHPCPRPPLSPPAPFGRSLPAGRLSARPLPLGPRGTLDSLFPGSGSTMRSCFSGRWPARPPSLPPRAHAFPPTSSLPLLLRSLFLKSLKQMRQRDSQPPGQRLPSSPPLDAPISSSFPRACLPQPSSPPFLPQVGAGRAELELLEHHKRRGGCEDGGWGTEGWCRPPRSPVFLSKRCFSMQAAFLHVSKPSLALVLSAPVPQQDSLAGGDAGMAEPRQVPAASKHPIAGI